MLETLLQAGAFMATPSGARRIVFGSSGSDNCSDTAFQRHVFFDLNSVTAPGVSLVAATEFVAVVTAFLLVYCTHYIYTHVLNHMFVGVGLFVTRLIIVFFFICSGNCSWPPIDGKNQPVWYRHTLRR